MKICAIGCGGHATTVHGPAQKKYALLHPGAILAACCDPNASRAEDYRQRFGFARSYQDEETMLDTEKPDAVCIVVPTTLTRQVVGPILKRGIPVMLEKPPGCTSAELEELIDAAATGGAPHQVAFNRRQMPVMLRAMERLNTFMPPKSVFQIDYEMIRCDRRDEDFSTTAIHAIDGAHFLARSPFRHAVLSFRDFPDLGPTVAGIELEVECESGTRIRLNIQPVAGRNYERISLHGHTKTLTLEFPVVGPQGSGAILDCWENDAPVYSFRSEDSEEDLFGFYSETRAFLDAVRDGRCPHPTLAECRQPVALMEAVRNRQSHVAWA